MKKNDWFGRIDVSSLLNTETISKKKRWINTILDCLVFFLCSVTEQNLENRFKIIILFSIQFHNESSNWRTLYFKK
jgi:hypothetical protein